MDSTTFCTRFSNARVTLSAEELDTISKANFRRISLGIRPMWSMISLTIYHLVAIPALGNFKIKLLHKRRRRRACCKLEYTLRATSLLSLFTLSFRPNHMNRKKRLCSQGGWGKPAFVEIEKIARDTYKEIEKLILHRHSRYRVCYKLM